jgi:hypothetical protein
MLPDCFGSFYRDNGKCFVCVLEEPCVAVRRGEDLDATISAVEDIINQHPEIAEVYSIVSEMRCPLCGKQWNKWGELGLHKLLVHTDPPAETIYSAPSI